LLVACVEGRGIAAALNNRRGAIDQRPDK